MSYVAYKSNYENVLLTILLDYSVYMYALFRSKVVDSRRNDLSSKVQEAVESHSLRLGSSLFSA